MLFVESRAGTAKGLSKHASKFSWWMTGAGGGAGLTTGLVKGWWGPWLFVCAFFPAGVGSTAETGKRLSKQAFYIYCKGSFCLSTISAQGHSVFFFLN